VLRHRASKAGVLYKGGQGVEKTFKFKPIPYWDKENGFKFKTILNLKEKFKILLLL